ncbi:MAG: hypothetical protein KIT84_09085 [Labilithrix sp.]|nr:hypothetical protein [Labilithrix sp.]MCW5811154.1 hypothetical protein [Labilithrix sp.]
MAEEPSAPSIPRTPTVFVTDEAAEASHVADTLRAAGYAVVDVALSLLLSRTQVQRPQVIIADVDALGALDELARVRKLPGSGAIDFVFFGAGGGIVKNADDALASGGSAFFLRPIDIGAVVRRLEALTGGPVHRPEIRPSTPPPSMPARTGSVPPEPRSNPSLPAPGLRTPGPPLPMSVPSLADLVDSPPRSLASFGAVSNELQQLLAEAEARADAAAQVAEPPGVPSPEEEIESVLPADVLASLDEPIEADEDEPDEPRAHTGHGEREGTGTHGAKPTTAGGSKHTTATGQRPISTNPRPISTNPRPISTNPGRPTSSGPDRPISSGPDRPTSSGPDRSISTSPGRPISTNPGRPGSSHPTSVDHPTREMIPPSRRASEPVPPPPPPPRLSPLPPEPPRSVDGVTISNVDVVGPSSLPARAGSEAPPQQSSAGVVLLRAVEARRFVGEAIARRASGSLCFEHERVVRRIVLREGDLVTAASGADKESLVCFLGARGDLPRDEVDRLAGKIPPYGRHAGAALVAHGWLGQDQLWAALRAHAEWLATLVLRSAGGTAQLEAEPPGRLRSEPSVFGASTGCEVFVELVRRAVSSEEAIASLGGEGARIGDGPKAVLLSECALPPAEIELVNRARGGSVADLLARSPEADVVSVVHALSLLGVLDVMPQVEPARVAPAPSERELAASSSVALDDEAIRARVRARLELVDEGDYFSLLGIPRDANSYEVKRAFVELRRAFEPTRILSPRLHDLAEDVKKIVVVLEEAYEILRDVARRERYRRAIDASPE